MSDKQTVVGRCSEISEKSGWTTFHIDVGSKQPLRLATKLAPLIEQARAAGGEQATWSYTERESDNINENTGKPWTNRYLEGVTTNGDTGVESGQAGAASAAPRPTTAPSDARAPLQGGDKDRAITRMACIRSAAQTLAGTHGDREDLEIGVRVLELSERYERWVMRDLEDIPF